MNIKRIIKTSLRFILVFIFLAGGPGFTQASGKHPAQEAGELAAEYKGLSPAKESTTAACTPDADGMRAYWPFDDGPAATVYDDVIENPAFNDGACTGGACPASTTSAKIGTAFVFDGSNDAVDVTNTSGLDFTIAGDMSVETWVKTSQDCTGRAVFVGRYQTPAGSAAWWLGCAEGNVAAFHMRDSNNHLITLKSTSVINDGEWHHVVGTRDGTANINKIYVDGVLENSGTPAFTGTLTFTAKDVTIGYYEPVPFYLYAGTLDEMALYDQALSADDVARHYLGGEGQSYCNDDPPMANGVTFQTLKDTPLQFTEAELLVNDIAPDGGLDLVSITSPSTQGGTITGNDPYTYSPKTDFVGTDQFDYKITDKNGKQADGVATVEVRAAPTLSWTGEPNYVSDGLHPESGAIIDDYIYRIKYSDADGSAPDYVRVHIKKGGTDITGSPFAMSCASGDYTAGVICSYTKVGLQIGTDFTYYFVAEDIQGNPATPSPKKDAPDVENIAPTISGLEDQFFDQDHLPPSSIDLWAYAEDVETPDSGLTFSINGTPHPGAGITLTGNRYLQADPSFDWCGYTDITVRVTDPGGLWDEDTLRVAVNCKLYLPVAIRNH